jgi:phosphohistidine phosphatase
MAVPPRIPDESSPRAGDPKKPRTLVLIRHGHAVQGADDKLRFLSDAGRRELTSLAGKLNAVTPQRFVCSSATRTRQSAEILRDTLGLAGELELHSGLYLASPQVILDCIRQTSTLADVCWVLGHNPGLSELGRLLGQTMLELNTGEAAVFRFNGEWAQLQDCPCELSGLDETPETASRESGSG